LCKREKRISVVGKSQDCDIGNDKRGSDNVAIYLLGNTMC